MLQGYISIRVRTVEKHFDQFGYKERNKYLFTEIHMKKHEILHISKNIINITVIYQFFKRALNDFKIN